MSDGRDKRFKSLRKALLRSPFYRNFSSSSLEEFPVINKGIFMKNFDAMNTKGIRLEDAYSIAIEAERTRNFTPMLKGVTVGLSTGTSGNRGVFLADESERAKWAAAVLDRVIGFTFKRRKAAFFLRADSNLYRAVGSRLIEFHFFDILQKPDAYIPRLNSLQPQLLIAQPSLLCILARLQKEGVIAISPQKIISVAEVLTPEDKMYLEMVFKITIDQVYQCTEGFLAATCSEGTLHFNEDFIILEKKYIDNEKKRFHPVITDLLRFTQPVIRYELNDIVIEKTDCQCGSTFTGIEQIEGRADDILTFRDDSNQEVSIFPDFFRRAIISSDASIEDFCLIKHDAVTLDLFVSSSSADAFKSASDEILHFLRTQKISNILIRKINHDPTIPGAKKRKVINLYGKTSKNISDREISAQKS